jgi:hypothetical protein
MPIVAGDIVLRYSIKTGAAGDSTASGQATSLGKYISTTVVATGANGLFDDITGAENAASEAEYRCIFVLNNHGTLTLQNAVVYLSAEVAGGAVVALATDNIAISAKGASAAQAAEIANEDTAPTGVSAFSSPTTAATGLALGSIGPGQVKGVWVRRTAANTAAVDNDGVTIAVTGDTAA